MPESGDLEPPAAEEAQAIRNAIKDHVTEHPDEFWVEDVERLMKEDHYLNRFYWHSKEDSGTDQVQKAVSRIKRTFQWRKETNPAGITASDISQILRDKGNLYLYRKDCDGKPLLVLCVKRHFKGIDSMDNLKKLVHFYMEKVDRETEDGLMSLVIDCFGGGLRGLDMELIQYLITSFKEYYPNMLNYIFVLEMPWVLNAAWKLIKSWLPAAGVRKIRFLGKSNMAEYVPADQQLEDWGGSVAWTFNFEDTLIALNDGKAAVVDSNGEVNGVHHPVNEPEEKVPSLSPASTPLRPPREKASPSVSVDNSVRSANSSFNEGPSSSSRALLKISTGDEVVFNLVAHGLLANFQISNVYHKHVAIKIMTTTPEKYRVKPSVAFLKVGESCNVDIVVSQSHLAFEPQANGGLIGDPLAPKLTQGAIAAVLLDKFSVNAISLSEDEVKDEDTLTHSNLGDLLRVRRPDIMHRLRCTIKGVPMQGAGDVLPALKPSSTASVSTLASANKQLESLAKKVDKVETAVSELQDSQLLQKRLVMLLLLLILGLQAAILLQLWAGPGSAQSSEGLPPLVADDVPDDSAPIVSADDEL